jgi:cytochrome c553
MKYIFLFTLLISLSNAMTTMCYKNNHDDPSSIENIALNGGECKGEFSLIQMKKNGWIVDDMKISMKNESMNYIYILKKEKNQKVTQKQVDKNVSIESKIDYKKLAEEMNKEKEKEESIDLIKRGEIFYSKTCITCHGQKGEIAQKKTRAINTLTLEEMEKALLNYQWGEVDSRFARIMKPYADLIVEQDIEAVYKYLQSLK